MSMMVAPYRFATAAEPGASPVFVRNSVQTVSASTASIAHTLNIVDGASGVWLACVASKNNETHSCATSGWSKIAQVNSGASFTASLWVAVEGSGNPTFTWSTAVEAQVHSTYWKYADAVPISLAVANYTTGNGTVNPVSTAAITATKNKGRAVYVAAISQASTLFGTPAGWTENFENGSVTSNIDMATGSKALALASDSSGSPSASYFVNQTWVMFNAELTW